MRDGFVSYDDATALIVVDVQNDFADPTGALYVGDGEAVVPVADGQIEAAERIGALVLYTQDWHPESTPHFEKDGGLWPVHCVRDTWGAKFHPDLRVVGDVVRKGSNGEDGYSAFSVRDPESGDTAPTIMHRTLTARGIRQVVICGLATDFCVVETVTDARDLGYEVVVLRDGIRAVERKAGAGDRALRRMTDAGATLA
ncbi:MAG: isochorismatase family protein [Actinomycetota bacterium]